MKKIGGNFEIRVWIQNLAKEPDPGGGLAAECFKINVDYEALSLLYNLQSQRKPLAEKFFDDVMVGIRTFGIGNNATTPIALTLLRTWVENNRASQDPTTSRTTASLALSNLNENAAR